MNCFLRRIKHSEEKERESFIIRNGKVLLEKTIAFSFGKRNPIRHYCWEELKTATNNFDSRNVIGKDAYNFDRGIGIGKNGFYDLYRGFLQSRPISVMRFRYPTKERALEVCFNNIVYGSQVSHKNLIRLIGCSLETEIPILVFESVEGGDLHDRLWQNHLEPLPFARRLKIAMDVANAIAYLHVGLSRPIVFRDIKPSNILFDDNNVPKLFDFSLCEFIPEGETQIETVIAGTLAFLAPEYAMRGLCSEKSDVFSFGSLLLELLTRKKLFDPEATDERIYLLDFVVKHLENNRITEVVDPAIIREEEYPGKERQLQALLNLAVKCSSSSPESRPEIVDVAKQLRDIYRSS